MDQALPSEAQRVASLPNFLPRPPPASLAAGGIPSCRCPDPRVPFHRPVSGLVAGQGLRYVLEVGGGGTGNGMVPQGLALR